LRQDLSFVRRLCARAPRSRFWAACAAAWLVAACGTSVDSLGSNAVDEPRLLPLIGPSSYPNAFADVLGKTDAEISTKLSQTFEALFHGDPATQAIYFPVGSDQALIRDILHGDVRTEGIGYGMIICVELDKRTEFDALWTYAESELAYTSGPERGYFRSSCDIASGSSLCIDPFGHEQILMALMFAHGRWGSTSGIDYETAARSVLHPIRSKVRDNGGIVHGITDMVDPTSKLFFDFPDVSAANVSRPAIEMPGYYELWGQATGDAFWSEAAQNARTYLAAVDHATTGLMPVRTDFAGTPIPGSDTFQPEGYRAQLNMALDHVWSGAQPWAVDESNRLLAFFFGQGLDIYGKAFTLDGATILDPLHEPSLVVMNGVSALIATDPNRAAFIDAVWNLPIPTTDGRYYTGILDLLALLILSGQYRVY
jgi:oligosaccharide reducing-end xylanase